MNNRNIDKAVYDKYVDAAVALFMEYYSATLLEDIRAETGETEETDVVFPEALDERCRALIKKACGRRRRKECWKRMTKGLHYVAVLIVALLSLSSFLFVTVEAFRISVINFYVEQNDGHWDISGLTDSNINSSNEDIDITDPLAGMIPEQYKLVFSEGDSLAKMKAIYEDTNGNQIFFSAVSGTSLIEVDSEEAQVSQKCQICGCDAVLVIEEQNVRIAWILEETSTIFTLVANDMSETEVVSLAERIVGLSSK